MSFSINTNITSLQAQNYLTQSSNFQAKTISEVTSGLRIVNSGDDAAGLAIANGYRSNEAVLTQGIQNGNNGLATLQTVDGGMSNISTLLDRAQTLATESASGTFTGNRATLNSEFQSVIQEVTRQATAIGMNQGGQFAQALSVYIGGGQGATAAAAGQNGSINLDLSKSAVDAQSLGLQGVQATGVAGTDIGSGSPTTSVSAILASAANSASQSVGGYTQFSFSGPGFGDSNKVSVAVNLSGVSDANTLAAAINTAIAAAGNGGTQSATAFKNANISASVVVDSAGKQQLAFSSSTAAFQVQAGDKTANALLGNFAQNAKLEGTDNNAALATNGLGFSSIQVDGKAVTLSAATTTAIAGGTAATSGGISGLATVSDTAIAALNSNTGVAAGDALYMSVDGVTKHVTFAGGETTLAQVASEITSAAVGVTASITGSGNTQKLTLTSNTTGTNSNVSVLGTGAGTSAELLAANITGFTTATAGTPGVNGAVATATSGSLTGSSVVTSTTTTNITSDLTSTAGTLVLNVNGTNQSVTLTSGTTTLAQVASQITASNAGVTATVITDPANASNEILTLTSKDTGSSSNVTAVSATTTTLAHLGLTAGAAGVAGLDATAPPSKGSLVQALNNDASFSSVATASLDGNKIVIQSNNNSATSSVQVAGTLASALGFSSAAATAAPAATGADVKTTVQGAGTLGNINQAVIGTLTAPAAAIAGSNDTLSIAMNGGTAVNLTLTHATYATNSAMAAEVNTEIGHSALAGQVTAVVNSSGMLALQANNPGQYLTVTGNAVTNLGFTSGQASGTATNVQVTSSDNIQVQFTGGGMTSPVTLSLNATTAGSTKVSDILADLTSRVANNSSLAAAGISLTTSTQGNNLVFTDSKGEKFQVAVTGDTNNVLGFGSFKAGSGGTFDYSSISGATSLPTGAPVANVASTGALNVSLNGGQTQSALSVALKSTSGVVTGTGITDSAVAAVGLSGSDKVDLLVNGAIKTVTFAAGDTSLSAVAATINATASLGVSADIVGTGANQTLRLSTTSAGASVTVLGTGAGSNTTAHALAAMGMTGGQTGQGLASAAAVQADAVNQINSAIANSAALSGAGLQASIVNNKLTLTSTNFTNFRVSGSGATDLGFGISGGAYAGTTNSAAPTVGRVDSAGAYTSSSMAFSGLANGADSQGVTITATDANGATHSQAITLENTASDRSGANIDNAIHQINTKLQQSNEPTLQSVYAVKETDASGNETIKFQSTTRNFKVAVSSVADGTGIAAPVGGVSTAAQNGVGSTADISTATGAQAAINALTSAVQVLGTAQAAIGKGENLLNYAVSLAQSQNTSAAASESTLRDANLAQEAANLTKAQILVQAGTAALAQANSAPQQLLSLLQGH